jgi:hypothetical protein
MTKAAIIAELRKRHFVLEALPKIILIPALSPEHDSVSKAIEEATVDDIAFAMRSVEADFNAIGDQLHALRKLYNLARQAGALGADRVIDAIAGADGGR